MHDNLQHNPQRGVQTTSEVRRSGLPFGRPRYHKTVLTVAILLTPQLTSAQDNWPMFRGGPQHTGVSTTSLPAKLTVRWKYEVGDAIASTAAIVDGTVYFGSDDEYVYALDFATGRLKWKYHTKAFNQSSPTVVGDTLYMGDDNGVMHAVDVRTGSRRWTYETQGQIISSANFHSDNTGERIVFGSYDGFVYSLNPRDGSLLWKHETEGRVHGTPAITKRFILVAGCDQDLHVLDVHDGKPFRKVPMGSVSGASVAVVGDRAFVGTYGNQVRCIDFVKGDTLWTYEDSDRSFPFMSSAAVTPSAVIIGGRDKVVHALHPKTGKELWRFVTKGRIDSSPVVVGKTVYIGSGDGVLYGLDIEKGTERWRFETGSGINASPAVAKQCMIIGTLDGVLYCFGSPSTTKNP